LNFAVTGASAIVGVDNEATNSTLASNLYDIHQGFGRVNLLNSLPLAGKNKMRALFVNSKSMRTGNSDYYEVTIDTSSGCDGPLSVTLVWTDPAGAALCQGSCKCCILSMFPGDRFKPDWENLTANNASL
jgi:hypothetical protein